ncbi:MAG: OmpA family protein [Bacteroidia bacterium]
MLLLSGCVIHLKPGISWCTSKTCIYDAYGLYAVKDFSHRTKAKIARFERKNFKHHEHHSDGETRIARKKPTQNKIDNSVVATTKKELIAPPIVKDTIVAVEPVKAPANLRINFAFDKDTISSQDKINIREYIAKIDVKNTEEILIKGFTDNAGSKAYNKHLSIHRAKRVYDYLVSLGVPAAKLSFKGFDFKDPVADNKTEEGRALNRRVEIEIVLKESL